MMRFGNNNFNTGKLGNLSIRETSSMKEWRGWSGEALAIAANASRDALVYLVKNGSIENTVY